MKNLPAGLDGPAARLARAVVSALTGRGDPASLLDDGPVGAEALRVVARRHKLGSHTAWAVERGLLPASAVTPEAQELLASVRRSARSRALASLAQTADVLGLLAAVGIPAITVKGAVLAQELFGDPAVRGVGDVDIVVSPEHAIAAESVLRAQGHRRVAGWADVQGALPVRSPLATAVTLRRGRSTSVDLQWRLAPRHRLRAPSLAALLAAAPQVEVAGARVRTLAVDDHLRFASVHAVVHEWRRLKWLVDFGVVHTRLGAGAHLEAAAAAGLARQTVTGLAVLDAVVGVAEAPPRRATTLALAAIATGDAHDPVPGRTLPYLLVLPDRWADRGRMAARFGLRLVPGALPTAAHHHPTKTRPPSEVTP